MLLLASTAAFVSGHPAAAQSRWEERPDWKKHFDAANVNGTLALCEPQRPCLAYNVPRAQQRYLPASTFKILNSLIALDSGVAKDAEQMLPWDGVDRGLPGWNRGLSLRDALRLSAVWYYQELARRLGAERMRDYVEKTGYGNNDIRGGIDRFWLDGELRISAVEQVDFLMRLHSGELPFSPRSIAIVKDILTVETTPSYTLRAKTGWARCLDASATRFADCKDEHGSDTGRAAASQLGWWVGYVEREGRTSFFALNIDIEREEDAQTRAPVVKAVLREMKIIE